MANFPANNIMSLTASAPRYDLAESLGPDLKLGDLLNGLADLSLGYGPAAGNESLRERIADAQGVAADDVLVTVGGMHALFLLAFTLLDKGAHAVITTPVFPLALATLKVREADVAEVPVRFEDGYRLDATAVIGALTPATRLVSIASPQNPSGVSVSSAELREVSAAMAECCPQAWLVVDETYREAVYGNNAPQQTALGVGANVVVCASLSKCHGAPGLRVGWLVCRDASLRAQLLAAKFNTVISNSVVDEALAVRVLDEAVHRQPARASLLEAGRTLVGQWVAAHDALVDWVAPDAGALCCIRLREDAFDDAAVARFHQQLAQDDARLADGTWFGEDARVLRVGFGLLPPEQTAAGLERVASALANLQVREKGVRPFDRPNQHSAPEPERA